VSNEEKILDLLENIIVLLSEVYEDNKIATELIQESLRKKDSIFLNESEKKLQMWLSTSRNKIISNTYRIPKELQEELKKKCAEEGYSLQEGISRLIQAYVSNSFTIKDYD
jgi:predicted DNA binding CopG/RHH family protein